MSASALLLGRLCVVPFIVTGLLTSVATALSYTTTTTSSSVQVGIVTWNLLAPCYTVHRKYLNSINKGDDSHDYLEWPYRQRLIVDILKQQSPTNDIICLQEVQIDLWDELQAAFNDTHTTLVQHQHKNQQSRNKPPHPVACAIMVRRTQWTVVHTESRSRALWCRLEHRSLGMPLDVACVHLDAGVNKDATRWNQLKSLLKRIHSHQYNSNSNNETTTKVPLILAGDFNFNHSPLPPPQRSSSSTTTTTCHPLYHILATGQIPQVLPWNRQQQERIHLPSTTLLPSWTRLLPLIHVQASQQQPTFAGGAILDSIWVSSDFQVLSTWNYKNENDRVERRRRRCEDGTTCFLPQPWPNRDVPSDHIPIGVMLTIHSQFANK